MTHDELKALRVLYDKANRGPIILDRYEMMVMPKNVYEHHRDIREALPKLIEEVERLQSQIQKVEPALKAGFEKVKSYEELATLACKEANKLREECDSLKAEVEQAKIDYRALREYRETQVLGLMKERDALKADIERNAKNHSDWVAEHSKVKEQLDRLAIDALAALSEAGICTPESGYRDEPFMLASDIKELARERDAALARVGKLRGAMLEIYEEPNKMGYPGADAICEEYGITAWTLASKAIVEDDKESGE